MFIIYLTSELLVPYRPASANSSANSNPGNSQYFAYISLRFNQSDAGILSEIERKLSENYPIKYERYSGVIKIGFSGHVGFYASLYIQLMIYFGGREE